MIKRRLPDLNFAFAINFIFAISLALTAYITSSFLEVYMPKETVGLLFAGSSLISLIFVLKAPDLITKVGISKVVKASMVVNIFSIYGLVELNNALAIKSLFVVYITTSVIITFCLDILLEHFTDNKKTGKVRGVFFTLYNVGYLISPLMAGYIMDISSFQGVYSFSGVFMIITYMLYARQFNGVEVAKKYIHRSIASGIKEIFKKKSLFKVFTAGFSLDFFFTWMMIYVPIYLREFVGFSWPEIGMIFAIMHLPYIIFEIPIGNIVDKKNDEALWIRIGLGIIAFSCLLMGITISTDFWVWVFLLTLSRLGAAFVLVSKESYFYKKIDENKSSLIAMFRNTGTLALIIGPSIASLALGFVEYQELFIVLAIIVIISTLMTKEMPKT